MAFYGEKIPPLLIPSVVYSLVSVVNVQTCIMPAGSSVGTTFTKEWPQWTAFLQRTDPYLYTLTFRSWESIHKWNIIISIDILKSNFWRINDQSRPTKKRMSTGHLKMIKSGSPNTTKLNPM